MGSDARWSGGWLFVNVGTHWGGGYNVKASDYFKRLGRNFSLT